MQWMLAKKYGGGNFEFFNSIGHEQTIVAVANGDIDGGVTWAAGLNDNWEDGYDSGALCKAVDAGLVDMKRPCSDLAVCRDP